MLLMRERGVGWVVSVLAMILSGDLVQCGGYGWFGADVIWYNLWRWWRCFWWDIHICCVLVLIFVLLKTSTKINRITQQISEIYAVVMGDLVRLAAVVFTLMVVWIYLPGFVLFMFGNTAPGRSVHTLPVQSIWCDVWRATLLLLAVVVVWGCVVVDALNDTLEYRNHNSDTFIRIYPCRF